MKMCISKIHLGRYKLEMLDDNNQVVNGYDCGLAGILVQLNSWLFVDEALAYQRDQRKSSDELGKEAIQKMIADNPYPKVSNVTEAKIRIAQIDEQFESATGWGSWMVEMANEREDLANRFSLPHKYQARSGTGGRVD